MYTKDIDYRDKLTFFDAALAWASEVNKDLSLKASSSEVIAAYRHLALTDRMLNDRREPRDDHFLFKNGDGTWNKILHYSEKKEMIRVILWLRARVIM